MIRNTFACDFETTTERFSREETHVYLWCAIDIENEKEYYGENISSFIDFAKSNYRGKYYFHNLKFDGIFILDYLIFHSDFVYDENPKIPKSYSILMSDMGQMYQISITFENKRRIQIFDSCKKFAAGTSIKSMASSFDTQLEKLRYDYETDEANAMGYMYIRNDTLILARALRYLYRMNAKKMTVGADAYERWKLTRKDIKVICPEIPLDVKAEIRKYYRGGYTYCNRFFQNIEIKNINGVCYDKNSMHPSSMFFNKFPCGQPVYFKGRYIENDFFPFHCQHIKCYFHIKKGKPPIIQRGFGRFANEYITEYLIGEKFDVYLTDIELKLFFECYEVFDLEYIDGYMFQSCESPFKEYINVFYQIKKESTGAKKNFAKLMLNSLYGKFGEKDEVIGKIPYDKNEIVGFKKSEPKLKKETKYLPFAIWITAYSRCDLIDKIIKAGGDSPESSFLYCDTDSLHCLNNDIENYLSIGSELGQWKKEYEFSSAKYIRPKCYYEDGKDGKSVHIAGLPYEKIKDIKLEEFNIGYHNSKLIPKIVKGGVLLVDIDYIIKEKGNVRKWTKK